MKSDSFVNCRSVSMNYATSSLNTDFVEKLLYNTKKHKQSTKHWKKNVVKNMERWEVDDLLSRSSNILYIQQNINIYSAILHYNIFRSKCHAKKERKEIFGKTGLSFMPLTLIWAIICLWAHNMNISSKSPKHSNMHIITNSTLPIYGVICTTSFLSLSSMSRNNNWSIVFGQRILFFPSEFLDMCLYASVCHF